MTLDEMLKHIRDEHHDGQEEYDPEEDYDYPGEYEPDYPGDFNNWDHSGGRIMRGTVAKRIRRRIYGEQSIQQRRRYAKETVQKKVEVYPKVITVNREIVKNIGLRQQYQDAKRDYRKGER